MSNISMVGMACRYPDATSPKELFDNALAGRRAFRRLPAVRMRLEDYWDPEPSAPDRFYARTAAVIDRYEFDRVAYKVAGSTYRSTDLTHWLALDVAADALADAGFPLGEGLPRERTGVIVGNTLTGEFSRANQLRLRWPYVQRTVSAMLRKRGFDDDRLATFLEEFERTYKSPFPAIDEDTLAGGLSNTIAGRICNHFDLKGGGYAIDGACSSSLLSVATACRALIAGELDVAVAGGVDLSIDPFEMIGFAKTGALATGEMRVYDRGSNGFWPGEGCGMVVLMREADARRGGHRNYTSIAGWGVSSDGKGGMTRPEVRGYQLALSRAYQRAGFGIESVSLFEGHGTGTKVGDHNELTALSQARAAADPAAAPAAIGSIKAMIGHTKAASGVAGLIKAAMAVHHEVIPPTVGCFDPHEVFTGEAPALRVLRTAEQWPQEQPVRAGVTAMGFGGINTHLVLENVTPRRRAGYGTRMKAIAAGAQDVELLVFDAFSPAELRERLNRVAAFVPTVAYAQLGDLAATLHGELRDLPWRAATVVGSPDDATARLNAIITALDAGDTQLFSQDGRTCFGRVGDGRVGYLFPGQGSGRGISGGALRRRFADVDAIYRQAALPVGADVMATEVAQPRIVCGSVAGLQALSALGIEASVAVGHSLGELTALHWAGAMDAATLLRLATLRGRTMALHGSSGTMAGLAAEPAAARRIIAGLPVVVAGHNSPEQTVIAGPVEAVQEACRRADGAGVGSQRLAVSHAFHSPLVADAAAEFGDLVRREEFSDPHGRVISSVTGAVLSPDTAIPELLRRQITAPVLFAEAVALAAKDVDLLVEVGPGRVLSSLARDGVDIPAVALDTDDESSAGLLRVLGTAFVVGATNVDSALFDGRLIRRLPVGTEFSFFASPCEQAPDVPVLRATAPAPATGGASVGVAPESVRQPADDAASLLRRLAAERAELPVDLVTMDSRMLDDLHLSSITVGQVVNAVAKCLGIPAARTPTNFATATLRELAEAMDSLTVTGQEADDPATPLIMGAADWVRGFSVDVDRRPHPAPATMEAPGAWQVFAPVDHPLAGPLQEALQRARVGGGVLVCLPRDCAEQDLRLALAGARAAVAGVADGRFVLVQQGRGAAGLAKTLHLEAPHLRTTIVHTGTEPEAVDRIVAEVAGTRRFAEAHHEADGTRWVPTLRPLPVRSRTSHAVLGSTDVLLVTGGGKGITAECALAMAKDSGAKLALLGRSDPASDPELAANLRRMTDAGITVRYTRADVTDPAQVRAAVAELSALLGPVTAVLHGAGRNDPAPVTSVGPATVRDTMAPKVDGLHNVLAAVPADDLRLLVALGSIIGRAGLRGEAHYATANEWLTDLAVSYQREHPACRTLVLEWSVWSGVGMGERLSVVEALSRDGITPVTPDQGVAVLRRLLADPEVPTVVVVSGRTEGIHTVARHAPELPLLRFVDRPLIRYHGVELVSETDLNAGTDPYLRDHLLDGNQLFPAVLGMEAMAQVTVALTGWTAPPAIEHAEFARPIVVPPAGSTTIRVAAVRTDDDVVDVVISSSETAFAVEHFKARLRRRSGDPDAGPPDQAAEATPPVPLDPARELYGGTLFQGARFQRLRRYHRASAHDMDATVEAMKGVDWFAGFLPDTLILGDPGVRDAMMHGIQVCVPDATLLPVRVDLLEPAGEPLRHGGELRCCAAERHRDGDRYVYDVALRDDAGTVVERWTGLHLQAVRKSDASGPWTAPLLGAHLQRMFGELTGSQVVVAVEPDDPREAAIDVPGSRRARTARASGRALGFPVEIRYRPDGRPEIDGERAISAAHGAGLTVCVAGTGVLACDVEPVVARPADVWSGLLGRHHDLTAPVATVAGDSTDTAATRVWTALECLRKAGHSADAPLALNPADRQGWVVFSSGSARIGVFVTSVRDRDEPVVFAVLAEGDR